MLTNIPVISRTEKRAGSVATVRFMGTHSASRAASLRRHVGTVLAIVLLISGSSALGAAKNLRTKISYGSFRKCPPTDEQPIPGCVAYPGALISDAELSKWLKSKKVPMPPANVDPGNNVNCSKFKDSDPKTVDWFRANTYFARYIAFGDPGNLDRGNKVAGPADSIDRTNIDEDPIVHGIAGVPCESLPGAPQVRLSQVR
jgi:hypothetical protein